MYELKRLLKRHMEENFFKYLAVLILLTVSILAGFVFSGNISTEVSDSLQSDVGVLMGNFSEEVFNKTEIFKTSFLKNLRITFLIFLGGLSVWMMPLSCFILCLYGFSLGFTLCYLPSNFGMQGLCIALISVVFTFLINIPVYTVLEVVALNNSLYKRRNNSGGGFALYTVVFTLLFLFSVTSVLADTFLAPRFISVICS